MEPDVSDALGILERTPAVLRALLEDVPEAWLHPYEGPGTFGAREVLGHLIHGEKTDWVPRIKLILESGDRRPFEPFDRQGFASAPAPSLGAMLDEFAALRRSSLDYVAGLGLTPAQLALPGRHPALGPVTLGALIATWVAHDLNHVGQVVRVMSKRYAEAVGPWKQYLGILNK